MKPIPLGTTRIGVFINRRRDLLSFDAAVGHVPHTTPQPEVFDLLLDEQRNGRAAQPSRKPCIYSAQEIGNKKTDARFEEPPDDTLRQPEFPPQTPRFTSPETVRFRMAQMLASGIESNLKNEHHDETAEKDLKQHSLSWRHTRVGQAKQQRHDDLAHVTATKIATQVNFNARGKKKSEMLQQPDNDSEVTPNVGRSKNLANSTHRFERR